MALNDLLSKLEGRAVDTSDTSGNGSAVSVKPLQDKACTPDTSDTAQIFNADDEARIARWLLSFIDADDTDDERRTCRQCQHLQGRACSIAKPGWLVSANRGYQPNTEILMRCAGYLPNDTDADQRPGGERWLGLTDTKGTK